MNKSELRKQTLEMLKSTSSIDKQNVELEMKEHILQSNWWKNAKSIGITMSKSHEWDTTGIIEAGWLQGKKMCVPKCYPEISQLEFYQLNTYDQLESVYYNLLEPKPEQSVKIQKCELDMIIVPGLLFDAKGFRLGYGGGYYDRYLENYNGITASFVSNQQITSVIPTNSYDIPVKHIVTETGILF
ncbi:5-formyltetrahydrofolate cyclo-ligase [Aquibacillus saliphilus]|uniref:5-formyltetrahydrofolate cyclo-ligase n=1 Tax=Aquibacillus saliphilus TaxID=1909422 RepID=UPI001CF0BA59|nr:5-formyltetrahydrofolate cyclo-ligase [Aquibacillus saliphilus]